MYVLVLLARHPGDDHQLVFRDGNIDVFQVVLARAAHVNDGGI